jgi:hypothetical protein
MSIIKEILLKVPDDALDKSMSLLVANWNDPPTAIQILEVLDYCILGSLTTGMVVLVLQNEYNNALDREQTTHEEVVKLATWRKQNGNTKSN